MADYRAKGGLARAAALSPGARSEIDRRAAQARWGGDPSAKPLTASQLRAIIARIERHKAAIAKHRDALRGIYDDLEAIVDSADDGLQSLDYAIQRLSEYL